MSFTFLSPAWLLLLLALPALWFFPRPLRGKEALQIGLFRSVVLGLLVIALARPASLTNDSTRHHAIVVDRSPSMNTSAALATALEADFRSASDSDDAITTFEVGAASGADPSANSTANQASTSPLGDGLLQAARSIPAGSNGAVTLITDGLATDKRWGGAIAELSSRGIPVHTLRAPGLPADARIVGIAPLAATLRVGTNATLEARIVDAPAAFDLVLVDGDVELARDSFTRAADDAAEVTLAALDFEPAASGFLSIEARIESATDLGRPENDTLLTTLAIQPPLRALYIGSRMQRGDEALSDLVGPGLELIPTSPAELSANDNLLSRADLVVLDDAPASTITTAEFEALQAAVTEAGIGLFASGGVGSFGPGGWHNTPIEDLLPVEFVQKEEKRDPSTTLVVIIDTSGSMGGQRVQLAKEVARLAIRRLLPHDKVGLVEFYGSKRWSVPIQSASNAI
ncbi:MAG: Ca-activated chloride channel family protein, partial [Gammaproteobacteria bacterium]